MEEIKGLFQKELYKDYKTGFSIFVILKNIDERTLKWDTVTCKSSLALSYVLGTPLILTGDWADEKTFIAEKIDFDNSEDMVAEFIERCHFPGIGRARACRIAAEIPDFFEQIKNPETIKKLEALGLSEEEAAKARTFFNSFNIQWELALIMRKHGGNYACAMRLYEKYGANAVNELYEHPYRTCRSVGVSLEVADSIAVYKGRSFMDKDRINSVISLVADRMEESGDTWIPLNEFLQKASSLTTKVCQERIHPALISTGLVNHKRVRVSGRTVYNTMLDRCEDTVAAEYRRLKSDAILEVDEALIDRIEAENGFKYARQQREAFRMLGGPGLKILTGGPGTGKTTTVDGLIKYFELKNPGCEIKLCAPTGRAAQRITEQTGRRATTIHQLLEFRPYGESEVLRNKDNPIDADMIVIDEMSMTDVVLFSLLLQAVKTGATVLMVGDVNQLASVGPGNVLLDLIDAYCCPTCMLTDVYRQAADSLIVSNAAKINAGRFDLQYGKDFILVQCEDEEEVKKACREYIGINHTSEDPFYAQMLSATHAGIAGVDQSNKFLQADLNHETDKFVYGGKTFLTGDKIIMMKNNFGKGYCNGDIGTIAYIIKENNAKKGVAVKIGDQLIDIKGEMLEDMELSYCTTVHKSQGSEYPVVVISMTKKSPIMLKRNLLYTGVTRAKKQVIIVNEDDAMQTAIATPGTGLRNTGLKRKLLG